MHEEKCQYMVHQPSKEDIQKFEFQRFESTAHPIIKMIMAQCITPYMLKEQQITVPCGKCPPCRARRSAGWAFRMMQEQKISDTSFMLTLTYNSDTIPITKNGYRSLCKTDVQKFIKRLRKASKIKDYGLTKQIRYYACGEYGTQTKRPHYHLLIYNAHPDNIANAWKLDNKEIGSIHLAPLNMATIQYAFKYLQKAPTVGKHERDDRQREFQLFSKGLGANYLSKNMVAWHKANIAERMHIPIEDGKKISMPRYYKNKIYDDFEKLQVKEFMMEIAEKDWQEMINQYGESLQQVLHDRRVHAFTQMHKKSKQNEKL